MKGRKATGIFGHRHLSNPDGAQGARGEENGGTPDRRDNEERAGANVDAR